MAWGWVGWDRVESGGVEWDRVGWVGLDWVGCRPSDSTNLDARQPLQPHRAILVQRVEYPANHGGIHTFGGLLSDVEAVLEWACLVFEVGGCVWWVGGARGHLEGWNGRVARKVNSE